MSPEAAPQCISGRTSYLRVRLAFHPYPQLIPAFCTRHGFGPSPRYYLGFNLAMGSSPGFGSNPDNLPGIVETPLPTSARPLPLARRIGPRGNSGLPTTPLSPPGHALFRLAFAMAPELIFLNRAAQINSPAHSSKGTRSAPINRGLPRLVGLRFQVYFTPLPGFFSPFPHGTGSLSVAKGI